MWYAFAVNKAASPSLNLPIRSGGRGALGTGVGFFANSWMSSTASGQRSHFSSFKDTVTIAPAQLHQQMRAETPRLNHSSSPNIADSCATACVSRVGSQNPKSQTTNSRPYPSALGAASSPRRTSRQGKVDLGGGGASIYIYIYSTYNIHIHTHTCYPRTVSQAQAT